MDFSFSNIWRLYIRRLFVFARTYGIREALSITRAFIYLKVQWERSYQKALPEIEKKLQAESGRIKLTDTIKFSIVIPTYRPPVKFLKILYQSIVQQTFSRWEIIFVDDGVTSPSVNHWLKEAARNDTRVKVIDQRPNRGIAAATNLGISHASSEIIVFVDHDDELHPMALEKLAECFQENPDFQYVFTDHDKIDSRNLRHSPAFKGDFDPERLIGFNFTCHLAACRRNAIHEVGGLRSEMDFAQDFDLALRIYDRYGEKSFGHISEILYHWRTLPTSTASGPVSAEAAPAAVRAIHSHIKRKDIRGNALSRGAINLYRIQYEPPHLETIIVCNLKDTSDVTIESLLEGPKISPDTIIVFGQSYFQPKNPEAVLELASQARRSEIGLVGPKVISRDHKVIHAGCVFGLGETSIDEPFRGQPRYKLDYCLDKMIVGSVSMIVGNIFACRFELFISAKVTPADFLNPWSLGYKLSQTAWENSKRVIWTPFSEFILTENRKIFDAIDEKQKKKWLATQQIPHSDPYYSSHYENRSADRAYQIKSNLDPNRLRIS